MSGRHGRRLVLVSASPRRKELLAKLGYPFDVSPSSARELFAGPNAEQIAADNARIKVERSSLFGDRSCVLIGADTIISLDDDILGKPFGEASARRMLLRLSGRTHHVVTGICVSGFVTDTESRLTTAMDAVASTVTFRQLTSSDISGYIRSREWEGKAGAYAIQGLAGAFVEAVSGDYDNVVGLPVTAVRELMERSLGKIYFC